MISGGITRLLLFLLVGFFVLVGVTQWLSAPDSTDPPVASGNGDPVMGGTADGDTPQERDTFDTVLLLYADGLAHVARRHAESGSFETAARLLMRVYRLRRDILGSDHAETAEAQRRHAEALRAHEGGGSGSTSDAPAGSGDARVDRKPSR